MRIFVQSLDGEARKWFRELRPRSIVDIEALDDAFLKHRGDKKDLLYYHTKFGNFRGKMVSCCLILIKDFTACTTRYLLKKNPPLALLDSSMPVPLILNSIYY